MTTLCPNGSYGEMNYLFNVTRQRLFIGHGQVLQPVRTITSCVVWPQTHSVKSELKYCGLWHGTAHFFFPRADKRALCNTVYDTASVPSCDTWGLTHVWGQGLSDSDASALMLQAAVQVFHVCFHCLSMTRNWYRSYFSGSNLKMPLTFTDDIMIYLSKCVGARTWPQVSVSQKLSWRFGWPKPHVSSSSQPASPPSFLAHETRMHHQANRYH